MKTKGASLFLLLVGVTAINAAYLASVDSATIFYYANVIGHVGLGIALAVALAAGALRAVRARSAQQGPPASSRDRTIEERPGEPLRDEVVGAEQSPRGASTPPPPSAAPRRSPSPPASKAIGRATLGIYALAALVMSASGLWLVRTGTSSPHYSLLRLHEIAAVLFLLLLALLVRRRTVGAAPAPAFAVLVAACLLVPAGARAVAALSPAYAATITNPPLPPETPDKEGAGKEGPFFPSSNMTASGKLIPSDFFLESKSCGNAGCHPDITAQWESSAHHFSSFNNQWYRKSIEYMQDTIGTRSSKWCGGCHDMAILLTGRMDRPIREQIHTPEAQAGIGCLVCHSIVHVHDTMGQGGFTIEYPEMHRLVASKNPLLQFLHDRMILLDPAPHKATMLKAFHRKSTPEFCSSCHKVHLDVPVNHYRWFRGFNDYDTWQQSGVSMQGARAFYYPDAAKKCGACHMPMVRSADKGNIDGMVHSHRFPGANTALPVANQDAVQLETVTKFLQDGILTLDIFSASEEPAGEAERAVEARAETEAAPAAQSMLPEEGGLLAAGGGPASASSRILIAPLERAEAAARPGATVRIDVVARTRKIGHFFPGGTVDAFDIWLELQAKDARGKVLFWNGWTADDGRGPVDPGAHFYRALLLDDHGNRINKRNAWSARVAAYVRLIPPGAADTAHFRLRIPADAVGPITLTARMNYRKFNWWNTQWSFAGVRDPAQGAAQVSERYDDGRWVFDGDTSDVSAKVKAIPDLPTIVVASKTATLRLGAKPEPPPALPADRERWNDFGIGLLLQKDYRAAASAFETVTRLEPGYADGWVNRARVAVEEGEHSKVLEYTDEALRLAPKLPKALYFRALALRTFGRYAEAEKALMTAVEAFPRDRVVLNALGRVLFLEREFTRAALVFKRTLAVDPEDVSAHYNLMLCYRGLHDETGSKRHEAFYRRFKADESAQAVTGSFRLLNPDENRERQAIHAHDSTWTPENLEAASGRRYGRGAPPPAPPAAKQTAPRLSQEQRDTPRSAAPREVGSGTPPRTTAESKGSGTTGVSVGPGTAAGSAEPAAARGAAGGSPR